MYRNICKHSIELNDLIVQAEHPSLAELPIQHLNKYKSGLYILLYSLIKIYKNKCIGIYMYIQTLYLQNCLMVTDIIVHSLISRNFRTVLNDVI